MWDEPVNDAIDEVARRMTEGAPDEAAAFRRRVLARIEAGDAPRRSWRAAFVLSPIAVAAAIVIAIVAARAPGVRYSNSGNAQVRVPPSPGGYSATRTPDIAGARASQRDLVAATARTGAAAASPAPYLRARAAGHRAVSPANREAGVIEPAAPPGSIALAPLAVGAVSADAIPIERLDTITPITVAPLEITDLQRRFE
jgi:hypothetical protein